MASRSTKKRSRREAGERAKLIGTLAQDEAALLLRRAELTVNASTHQDDEGWDLFVQFPTSLEVKSFLDAAPPSHSCLVQVKAIEDADGRVRMTLANALKLAKSPVPTFVLVAHMPVDRIEKLWLLHCDAAFVERALKRAAQLPSASTKTLNKREFDVTVPDVAAVAVDAAALRAAVRSRLHMAPAEYFQQKQGWLRDVGYGEARKQLGVVFRDAPTDADHEELADFAVGMQERLLVRRVDIADLRFGLERHEQTLESAEFFWPTVPTGPSIDMLVESGSEVARVRCTTHLARAVFPFLPEKYDRFVLRGPYLRLFARRNGETFSLSWSSGPFVDFSLAELQDAALAVRCVRLVRSGRASIYVDGLTKRPIPISMSNTTESGGDLRFLEDAATVVPQMGLPADARLSFDEIAEQRGRLQPIALALSAAEAGVAIQFASDSLAGKPALGDVCAFLVLPWVRFADVSMVCVLGIVGPLEQSAEEPARQVINGGRLRLLGRRLARGASDIDTEAMLAEARELLAREGVAHIYQP